MEGQSQIRPSFKAISFASQKLDFLFLVETWLRPGDLSFFSDLCLTDCGFLNLPRAVGRGVGVWTHF